MKTTFFVSEVVPEIYAKTNKFQNQLDVFFLLLAVRKDMYDFFQARFTCPSTESLIKRWGHLAVQTKGRDFRQIYSREIYCLRLSQYIRVFEILPVSCRIAMKKKMLQEHYFTYPECLVCIFRIPRHLFAKGPQFLLKKAFKAYLFDKKITSGNSEIALLVWVLTTLLQELGERTKSNRKCRMVTIDVISLQDLQLQNEKKLEKKENNEKRNTRKDKVHRILGHIFKG